MTKDEIQALSYKAKLKQMLVDGRWGLVNLEVFVDLVLQEERKACAELCEDLGKLDCAAAIRARNNVQQEPQSKD